MREQLRATCVLTKFVAIGSSVNYPDTGCTQVGTVHAG